MYLDILVRRLLWDGRTGGRGDGGRINYGSQTVILFIVTRTSRVESSRGSSELCIFIFIKTAATLTNDFPLPSHWPLKVHSFVPSILFATKPCRAVPCRAVPVSFRPREDEIEKGEEEEEEEEEG